MWLDRKLSAETQPKMTAVEVFKRRHTVILCFFFFFSFPRKVRSLTVHCCLVESPFFFFFFSFSCTGGVGNFKINLDANRLSCLNLLSQCFRLRWLWIYFPNVRRRCLLEWCWDRKGAGAFLRSPVATWTCLLNHMQISTPRLESSTASEIKYILSCQFSLTKCEASDKAIKYLLV